jgi:hypothetical protein
MQIRKTLYGLLGLAVAAAIAPMSLQAASPLVPSLEVGSDSLIQQVQAKKATKAKPKAKKGKKMTSRAGHCGAGKYWSRSKRSCQDAALGPAKK